MSVPPTTNNADADKEKMDGSGIRKRGRPPGSTLPRTAAGDPDQLGTQSSRLEKLREHLMDCLGQAAKLGVQLTCVGFYPAATEDGGPTLTLACSTHEKLGGLLVGGVTDRDSTTQGVKRRADFLVPEGEESAKAKKARHAQRSAAVASVDMRVGHLQLLLSLTFGVARSPSFASLVKSGVLPPSFLLRTTGKSNEQGVGTGSPLKDFWKRNWNMGDLSAINLSLREMMDIARYIAREYENKTMLSAL